jgi:cyclic-di-GMP-binding protein
MAYPAADAGFVPAAQPDEDPLRALEDASFWLQTYRQSLPEDPVRVYQVVDRVDELMQPHRLALMREYLDAGGRMQTYREHRVWRAAVAYARELADGYECCLRTSQKAKTARARPLLATIAARCMRAHTLELRWALLRYNAVEDSIWKRMGTLYAYCERANLATLQFKVYPGMAGHSTVRREYLRALVQAVSAMGNLLPAGQVIAERVIAYVAEFFLLHRHPAPGCHFAVDLQASRPPHRIGEGIAPGKGVRFFGPGDAGVMLEGLSRQATETRGVPPQLGLAGDFEAELVVEVLQHLARHWGEKPPARGEARQRVLATMHVAYGFERIVAAVGMEPGDSTLDEVTEAWTVENESSGGFGALLPTREEDWLAVGRMLAAKPDWPASWSVGVIRRVTARSPMHRSVGVQVLARGGVVVELVPLPRDQGPLPLEGILLPIESQTSSNGGEVAIVLPKGVSAQLGECEMSVQGRAYVLSRRRIVDSGVDFEVTRFAVRPADAHERD